MQKENELKQETSRQQDKINKQLNFKINIDLMIEQYRDELKNI